MGVSHRAANGVLRGLSATIVGLGLSATGHAAPPKDASPPVQRPSTLEGKPSDQSPKPDESALPAPEPAPGPGPDGGSDPGGERGPPPATQPPQTGVESAEPSTGGPTGAPTVEPGPQVPPPAQTQSPAGPTTEPAGDTSTEPTTGAAPPADLLAPSDGPAPARRVASEPVSEQQQADLEDEARARYFDQLYRPASNPVRYNMQVQGVFAAIGTADTEAGGRMGGARIDAGVTWNQVGAGLSLAAMGGSVALRTEQIRITSLVGGGPTIGLGRLALLRQGFFDLRVGYDFYWGGTTADPRGGLPPREDPVEPVAPHGPRLQLNMGLLASPAIPRRFFHGAGVGVGYQALVGSLAGDMPFSNVLSVSLNYWLG